MRIFILIVLLSILPSGLIAQGKVRELVPIDYSKGELGKNFQGHDLNKLGLALLEKAAPKKEFEKTVDYDARIAKLKDAPLVDQMKIDSSFILVPENFEIEKTYNADAEKLSCKFSTFSLLSLRNRFTDSGFVFNRIEYQSGKRDLKALGLDSEAIGDITVEVPVPIKEAEQVKNRLLIAICFTFEEPYLEIKGRSSALEVLFIGKVKNLLFFDPVTGHIYKKVLTESQAKSLPVLAEPTTQSFKIPEIQRVSGGVLTGKAIRKTQPPYPAIARAARAQGAVQVAVTVSKEGQVISAEAVGGHPLLKEAAVEAAKQWTFQTTEISGQLVKVQGILTFNFTLQ